MNDVQKFIENVAVNPDNIRDTNDHFLVKFDLIASHPQENLKIIKSLDVAKHTISLTWLYFALLSNKPVLTRFLSQTPPPAGADRQTLLDLLGNFLSNFNVQVHHHVAQRFYQLVSLYADYLVGGSDVIVGIKPIMTAIQRIQQLRVKEGEDSPYAHQICGSLHREFAKLCLKAKCYQHSLQVIDFPTVSFLKHTQPMDIVSYLYYKGLIYTGLKRYKDAIEQFRLVLSYPAGCIHKVHTEAYKKLILLTLIQVAEGKIPISNASTHINTVIPKNTHQGLKFKLESGLPSYNQLADAFINREKPAQFEELLVLKQEEFMKDQNLGLIKKLVKVYRQPLRLRMVELSDTYLTLKLSEIDTSTYTHKDQSDVPEVPLQTTLFEMITGGQIKAKIDQKQEMISFIDHDQKSGSHGGGTAEYLEVVEELESQNKRIIQLMKQLQGVDSGIRTSKQYIKRELTGVSGAPGGGPAQSSGGNMMMM